METSGITILTPKTQELPYIFHLLPAFTITGDEIIWTTAYSVEGMTIA
jgi:hypothetical protein